MPDLVPNDLDWYTILLGAVGGWLIALSFAIAICTAAKRGDLQARRAAQRDAVVLPFERKRLP